MGALPAYRIIRALVMEGTLGEEMGAKKKQAELNKYLTQKTCILATPVSHRDEMTTQELITHHSLLITDLPTTPY